MTTKDIQTHKLDVVTIPLNKNLSIAFCHIYKALQFMPFFQVANAQLTTQWECLAPTVF